MKKCGIYKITSPSGKVYIGQSVNIQRRFSQYKRLKCEKQPILYNSLLKYSAEAHIFEIIQECTVEELPKLEQMYIVQYNSYQKGMNCSLGGEIPPSILPEVKLKQSITRKAKFKAGTLVNPMQGRTGKLSGFYGKKHKLDNLSKFGRAGSKNHKSRKVTCNNTDKTWDSARKAWLELYSTKYSYNYFKCMISGHNINKTTLSYV